MEWDAHGLFQAHRYHLELNWTDKNKLKQHKNLVFCFFVFSGLTKSFRLCDVFQTSHGFNLNWGLPIHTKFDDLDFASESQMCQKLANRIFYDICFILVHSCLNIVWLWVWRDAWRKGRERRKPCHTNIWFCLSLFVPYRTNLQVKLSNRSNVTQIKSNDVSSMEKQRKT